MDQVFRAGRAIGRAVLLLQLGKNGSRYLNEAASALQLSRISLFRDESAELRRIASNWKLRSGQLSAIFARVRDEAGVPPKVYHAVCSGLWMGMAIEGCHNVGDRSDLLEVKSNLMEYLTNAKAHARALKLQNCVPGIKDFGPNFDRLIFAINTIGNTSASPLGELRRSGQLIMGLSNQLGNAIR